MIKFQTAVLKRVTASWLASRRPAADEMAPPRRYDHGVQSAKQTATPIPVSAQGVPGRPAASQSAFVVQNAGIGPSSPAGSEQKKIPGMYGLVWHR
jgi:hypothetical protein